MPSAASPTSRPQLNDHFPADRIGDATSTAREMPRLPRPGYRAASACLELLITTEAIRRLAHDRANTWTIQKQAREQGMQTMRRRLGKAILAGITTIEEIVRVTKGESVLAPFSLSASGPSAWRAVQPEDVAGCSSLHGSAPTSHHARVLGT